MVVADVVVEGGQETVRLIQAAGGEGLFVKTDVSRAAEVEALIKQTLATYGRLDCAHNNAGVEGTFVSTTEYTEADWDRVLAINLKGVWLCLKYEIQQMLKQGGGTIVNMSSVAGLMGAAGAATYCASKHGVIGLTRAAALETASKGIRVNAICPAVIETAMADRAFGDPEVQKRVLAQHPVGRFGKGTEVAEGVLFLCSSASSFMTGHYLVLDGGMLAGINPNA